MISFHENIIQNAAIKWIRNNAKNREVNFMLLFALNMP
jgi:hypothetical protein